MVCDPCDGWLKLYEYLRKVAEGQACSDVLIVGLVIYAICALDKDHEGPHKSYHRDIQWQKQ